MDILWNIIELLATTFENLVVIFFLKNTLGSKFYGVKDKIITIAVIFFLTIEVSVLNTIYVFESWLVFITIAIVYLYVVISLKGSLIYKTVLPIISYSAILLINTVVTYALSSIFGRTQTFIFAENDGARLIALFLTKSLFFFIMKLVASIFKKENINLKNLETIVTLIMSMITFLIAIAIVIVQIETKSNNTLIFTCILGILFLDIFIIYVMKKLTEVNKNKLKISLLELQLSEQKSMIENVGTLNKEIKKVEHDLRHHLLSLLGTVQSGDLQSTEKYLKKLLHEYKTNIFNYIMIDNSTINSILNLKIGQCHAENIDIKVEIESNFDNFNDIDLCVLLSNLLDNAIEASTKVIFPCILLTITSEKNYLCIMVKNKINYSVLENNQDLKTTKSDKLKHGLGLYSVSQIVKKYDGIKNYYEENNYFIADIWLKQNIISISERIKFENNYQTRQK